MQQGAQDPGINEITKVFLIQGGSKSNITLGMVTDPCDLSSQEAGVGRLGVQGQPGHTVRIVSKVKQGQPDDSVGKGPCHQA